MTLQMRRRKNQKNNARKFFKMACFSLLGLHGRGHGEQTEAKEWLAPVAVPGRPNNHGSYSSMGGWGDVQSPHLCNTNIGSGVTPM